MASEYTTNYQLDLYVGTDRPNLTDQYNSAMRKLDSVIYTQTGQGSAALQIANQAQATANEALAGMQGIDDDISTLTSGLATANANIATNTTNIANVSTDLAAESAARASADTRLESMISGMGARNSIGIIGDSFSSGGEWANIVAGQLGCNVINKAVSGAGFCVANNTFVSQLSALFADANFSDVHTIIVYGGTNDQYAGASESQVVSAMQSFLNVYQTLPTPRPKLILAYGNMGFARSSNYNAYGPWYSRVCNAVREANIPGFVDHVPYWLWGTANAFQTDQLHPSTAGYKVVADYIMQLLAGVYTGVHFTRRVQSNVGTGSGQVTFDNGMVQISIIANNYPITPINGDGTKLADFSAYTFTFGDSTRANIVNNVTDHIFRITANNSSIENTLLQWRATQGTLYIQRWGAAVLSGQDSTSQTMFAFGW